MLLHHVFKNVLVVESKYNWLPFNPMFLFYTFTTAVLRRGSESFKGVLDTKGLEPHNHFRL
jgi:hypothetical protein